MKIGITTKLKKIKEMEYLESGLDWTGMNGGGGLDWCECWRSNEVEKKDGDGDGGRQHSQRRRGLEEKEKN